LSRFDTLRNQIKDIPEELKSGAVILQYPRWLQKAAGITEYSGFLRLFFAFSLKSALQLIYYYLV
jgi:hypothetical protein